MRNLFVACFGLLPLWLAACFIAYGYMTMPFNNAGMLLWVLVIAIPASIGTMAIALATNALYDYARGSKAKRASIAVAFFFVSTIGLVLLFTKNLWSR